MVRRMSDVEEDVIEVYDIPLKWKAVFLIKNVLFQSEITFGMITVRPKDDKGTCVLLEFTTDTPNIRVAKARAMMLLEGLKNIFTLYIGKLLLIELTDLKMLNPEDIKGKKSVKVLTGESYFREKLLELVKFSGEDANKLKRIYEELFPCKLRFVSGDEYYAHYSLLTALHWYTKSMKEKRRSDQLVSLWISFNAVYSFVWRRSHRERGKEVDMIRYAIIQSNLLKPDESKGIIDRHPYMMYKAVPEAWEKSYAIKQFGKDWRKYYNNPYGFDFWKYYSAKHWLKALAEIVLFIYGVRNGIFHGGWLPVDSELLSESVFALNELVNLLLQRLLESIIKTR